MSKRTKSTKEYFDFINEIKKNQIQSRELIINPSRPTSLNIDANLTEEIKMIIIIIK